MVLKEVFFGIMMIPFIIVIGIVAIIAVFCIGWIEGYLLSLMFEDLIYNIMTAFNIGHNIDIPTLFGVLNVIMAMLSSSAIISSIRD
jgi:hypothetical protein